MAWFLANLAGWLNIKATQLIDARNRFLSHALGSSGRQPEDCYDYEMCD